MMRYEGIEIKPGPDYNDDHELQLFHRPFYISRNPATSRRKYWDRCHYVVKIIPNCSVMPVMKWKIDTHLNYIVLPSNGSRSHEILENGKQLIIIRTRYRTLFKCILKWAILKTRAQLRIRSKKNMKEANLFLNLGIGHSHLENYIIQYI